MSLPITRLAAIVPLYRAEEPLRYKQRLTSAVAGASLVFTGLRRGGFFGVVLAVAGADLVYRGVCGEGHVYNLIKAPNVKLLPKADSDTPAA